MKTNHSRLLAFFTAAAAHAFSISPRRTAAGGKAGRQVASQQGFWQQSKRKVENRRRKHGTWKSWRNK